MPCPLFLPDSPAGDLVSDPLPLGDLYSGRCAAEHTAAISGDMMRRCCNIGYARGICVRAAESESDAARFLIRSDRDGRIEVAWSLERNHHPVAIGNLELDRTDLTSPAGADSLSVQARAYASSYMRRTGGAPHP